MRDLLYKNLTSDDKRRKIISSSEISDKEGVRSAIHRHFIWIVKEVSIGDVRTKPTSSIYIIKEKINRECKQRFICRIKGGLYVTVRNKVFLVMYVHSLKIYLQDLTQISPK
ncbi:MAG: hypothetical protein ABSE81_01225 [Candidatus Omnitrophota bacterium]|jgi:hypothetical protein